MLCACVSLIINLTIKRKKTKNGEVEFTKRYLQDKLFTLEMAHNLKILLFLQSCLPFLYFKCR